MCTRRCTIHRLLHQQQEQQQRAILVCSFSPSPSPTALAPGYFPPNKTGHFNIIPYLGADAVATGAYVAWPTPPRQWANFGQFVHQLAKTKLDSMAVLLISFIIIISLQYCVSVWVCVGMFVCVCWCIGIRFRLKHTRHYLQYFFLYYM